ncbi:MAG: RhuM family protein [Treponema sp.]
MAELFDCSETNITHHISHIYEEKELDKEVTTEESSVVQTAGKRQVTRPVTLYSLKMIIAAGCRGNSEKLQCSGEKIMSSDITVAKNYLLKDELDRLNRIVSMYMKDWRQKLDAFLQFGEFDILNDNGKVSHAVAASFAEKEYEKFKPIQDREYVSDFDKLIAESRKEKDPEK